MPGTPQSALLPAPRGPPALGRADGAERASAATCPLRPQTPSGAEGLEDLRADRPATAPQPSQGPWAACPERCGHFPLETVAVCGELEVPQNQGRT